MRVISQNGLMDVPYEEMCFEIADGTETCVYARSAHITSSAEIICMANYSTKEKAVKAIDMLHEAYLGLFLAKNIEAPEDFGERIKEIVARGYGVVVVNDKYCNASFEPLHTVWRFPQEDEI